MDSEHENSILDAMSKFKSKLVEASKAAAIPEAGEIDPMDLDDQKAESGGLDPDADEQNVCDLHFIPNCKSCNWHDTAEGQEEDEKAVDWMSHKLTFEKDRLGKDLMWKKKNEEELVVIDTREKTKDILHDERKKKDERRGKRTQAFRQDGHHARDRDRDRDRRGGGGDRDRDRR